MNDGRIVPVDLRERRRAAGLTQQEMAGKLAVTRVHYSRIETGAANVSFPSALACAELFGSLVVECDGERYTIRRGEEPAADSQAAVEKCPAPGLGEAALAAVDECDDVPEAIARLGKRIREIGPEVAGLAHDALIDCVVEAMEAREALDDFVASATERHPGVVEEAEERRRGRETSVEG
ncbi:MAG: helix-turn-helix transcriptional regulator [Betaproteobacteria bacterium]